MLRFDLLSPLLSLAMTLGLFASHAHAEPSPRGGCDPCDVNCDTARDLTDIEPFVALLIEPTAPCLPCAGDMDASGEVDGRDIDPFVVCMLTPPALGACCTGAGNCTITTESQCTGLWLGDGTTCTAGACSLGQLTAYRPQHGGGYFPFSKTAVAEMDEESPTRGAGIRINAPGDVDPSGEDDLIELLVQRTTPTLPVALRRGSDALRVWTTRTKSAGTEIAFMGDRTGSLPFNAGATSLTLWVEWAAAIHGDATLTLEPLAAAVDFDAVRFHTFGAVVLALGGEDQSPSVPVDANHGTFVVGVALYGRGYDVHMFDEDLVSADGSGPVYNEAVTAVRDRLVSRVSIFGYSHGGGSTYDLADRLDLNRAGIGVFEIRATSYVDAVENDSDFDVSQELRRPPSTGYHANHYQNGSLSDFFLDGGPVPDSNPPPTGLNVETTPWGAGSTHFQVDDFIQVRSYIEAAIETAVLP